MSNSDPLRQIQILNTSFAISGNEDLLVIADAFEGGYGPDESRPAVTSRWQVAAGVGDLATGEAGEVRPVHRSKHPHWSFDSVEVALGYFVWPSRRVAVRLGEGRQAELIVSSSISAAQGAEALYHLLRSIALYEREPDLMLHASAVRLPNGRMLAFSGNQGSGKTTMVLHLLKQRPDIRPLTNDRLVLRRDPQSEAIEGWSWPSYFSLCEGTILDFPELLDYAHRYEEGLPVTTVRWGRELRPTYSKLEKRVYPMNALREAYARPYARTGNGLTIVFPALDTGTTGKIEITGMASDELAGALEGNTFSGADDSFLPWHGLGAVAGPEPLSVLRDVQAFRLAASIDQLPRVPAALLSAIQ